MKYFKSILLTVLLLVLISEATPQVAYNSYVAQLMNTVNQDTIRRYIRELTGDTSCIIGGSPYTLVSRYWNTSSNIKAAQYIYEHFQSYGITTWYQVINSTITNVLAKKVGTKYPNQYFIICGHYDDMPSGSLAPGADDNASGTVCVLEAARILKNINFPYTIVFAAWDEEERGLYGSKAYADTAARLGDSILGVLNLDMISYDGNNDGALDINTNPASMPLANEFSQIVTLYQPTLVPQVTTSLNGGSDHQSFQQKGYKAILSIEDNNDFTPYYHTVNDKFNTLNFPYFVKMLKAAVAGIITWAGDYKINIDHTPLSTGPVTTDRIATAVIKSSYKLGTGTTSPKLYYKINNGSYIMTSPTYSNLDTFKFTIPGQTLGTTVNYYIAAQDSAGTLVATSPSGGSGFNPPGSTPPPTQYSYQVMNVTIVTIGGGTTAVGWPFYTFYMDSRTDMLYNASEIIAAGGSAGNISKIGFNVVSAASQIMNGFKVRMQNYTQSTVTSFVSTGWTDVYTSTHSITGTGWQYIDLQTPFYWDGTSNLLMEICFNNSSYTSNTTVNATTMSGKNVHQHSDLSSGDGCVQITSPGSSYTARPNISIWLGTGPTGVTGNNPNIPDKFELSQNYPNPFNPVTKINYSIKENSFVTIQVFDLLGREVALLVNEVKPSGFYSIDFNASSLSSGVYIYKMKAGYFESMKRLVVVK